MTRRFLRRAACLSAIPALICAGLLAWSLAKPSWISRGHMSAGVSRGQIEIGWGSGTIVRDPRYWVVKNSYGYGSILVGPQSAWRPTISRASMGMSRGPTPAPLFKLSALYIPLWPLLVLFGAGTALLWWRSRHVFLPGHCRTCGYNLEGLAADRCPECGTPHTRLSTRIIRTLSARRSTRPGLPLIPAR